jgi:altronate dehydratase
MRALCLGGMKESTQQQIQIQETCSFGLIKLIQYLYTKQFDMEDVNDDNIVEVLIVSDKYGCSKLKDQVEKIMISSELTHENVSGLLVISDRHNANKLKQVCCEYIRQHYKKVKKTSQYREIRSEVENIFNKKNKRNNTCTRNNTKKDKLDVDETDSPPSKKQRKQ